MSDPTPTERYLAQRAWDAIPFVCQACDFDRDPVDVLAEHFAAALGSPVACAECEKPATCIGSYEGMETVSPACDECCGHGNEDGSCHPVAATPVVAEPVAWRVVCADGNILDGHGRESLWRPTHWPKRGSADNAKHYADESPCGPHRVEPLGVIGGTDG